jgi:uncharacterized protein
MGSETSKEPPVEMPFQPVTKLGSANTVLESDSPSTRSSALTLVGDREIGIWEVDPGIEHDVEVDEIFVVVSGSATITVDGHDPVDIGPGDVVHLAEGAKTTWEVHERLRKIYIIASDEPMA